MARPRSFEELLRNHGDRVYQFCSRLCGHREDAEDLAQEVLVLAYQGLAGFRGQASLATWLYRIALHRWQRVSSRPVTLPLADEDLVMARGPDPARQGLDRLSLEAALADLPEPLRLAFLLVKAEELSYREAALVLEVPVGTVQSRVHHATLRLRQALREHEEPQPQKSKETCDAM
ncbi:MAG TPA: RNA polymerase sigma factor [Armatimonadota bacterium]|jgi:RNA polymerase sigma-70 factor (ECF subfamily)